MHCSYGNIKLELNVIWYCIVKAQEIAFMFHQFDSKDQGPNMQSKDPFNLSNDEFYNPKLIDSATKGGIGTSLIQVRQLGIGK